MKGILDKQFANFGEWLYTRLVRLEIVLLPLAAIGYLLKKYSYEAGEVITTISLVTLALAYFFSGFGRENENSNWTNFYMKLVYLSLTVVVIGALSVLLQWPGFSVPLQFSLISAVLAILIGVIEVLFIKQSKAFQKQEFIRLILSLFIVLSLTFLSGSVSKLEEHEHEFESEKNIPEAQP